MRTEQRTEEMIKSVCSSLIESVPDFMDFPLNIQHSIVKYGVLQEFESGRTIIRQNHKADNYYFIISGISKFEIHYNIKNLIYKNTKKKKLLSLKRNVIH